MEIKDLDALAKAAEDVGLELVRDATKFAYWRGAQEKCDHKLVMKNAGKGAHEIGLRYTDHHRNSFTPWFDNYGSEGRAVESKAGAGLNLLKQHYAKRVADKHLKAQGYRTRVVTAPDGRMQVHATR